jgi:hypothetical protein
MQSNMEPKFFKQFINHDIKNIILKPPIMLCSINLITWSIPYKCFVKFVIVAPNKENAPIYMIDYATSKDQFWE